MISRHYMVNIVRDHRVLLLFAFVVVGLFQVLILTLVVGADLLVIIEAFYQQMPPAMQALFGEQFLAQFSAGGAVAFGYNHPLVLVMLIVVAILLPSRHLAGEIEDGTLELLFALPVRRHVVVLSLWLATGIVLAWLVVGCWGGTGVGVLLFPETRTIDARNILAIGVNLWALLFAISSYTLLLAAYARESGKATLRAVSLTLIFYFLNFTVILWPDIDALGVFTVFHYYQAQQLANDAATLGRNAAVLGLVSLVCGALAVHRVRRRDIPG